MERRKRMVAFLLVGILLLFSIPISIPINILAAEQQYRSGLCEHHPEHTDECGYMEGLPGTSCSHEHTNTCYRLVEKCIHEHTEDCYLTEDNESDGSVDTDTTEPTKCTHICNEESGCIIKDYIITEKCIHEHTEDCYLTEDNESDGSVDTDTTEPTECTHICSEESSCIITECTITEECIHEHTEECYLTTDDSTADSTDMNSEETLNCTHTCSEESGCITKEYTTTENCVHEHIEECYPTVDDSSDNTTNVTARTNDTDDSLTNMNSEETLNCTHICSEESGCIIKEYTTTENCVHEHIEECYPTANDSNDNTTNVTARTNDTDDGLTNMNSEETLNCTHICSEENGCITKVLDCPHEKGEHTPDCGYTEEIPAKPCTYFCEICNETPVEWPDAPEWTEKPENIEDGEIIDQIYGKPALTVNSSELAQIQKLSLEAPVIEDPNLKIEFDEISGPLVFIYINGEAYKGGDLDVIEGDNFSYNISWSPNLNPDIMTWGEGSWFEFTAFQVPGLNLANTSNVPLNIGGIKVGEYFLTYDKATGKMTYKVVFNRYIQFFKPSTILAQVQGSGKFIDTLEDGDIIKGNDSGKINISPRPQLPEVPSTPGGIGWQPPKAPTFDDIIYPFGKGVKWNSSSDSNAVPQIEWRVVFLEQLQKIQREFLNTPNWQPTESDGYVIIEDTIDVNQRFCNPKGEANKYGNAPFFFEIPILVPGTGTILNGSANVGDGNYDGPGEIYSLFTGHNFKEVSSEEDVRNTPFTWTITTNSTTREQTLIINAGKLGTTNPNEGMTWEKTNNKNWPEIKLQEKINECINQINIIKSGQNSPISLLHQRANNLLNILDIAANLPENEDKKEELKKQIEDWNQNYTEWYKDPNVAPLLPLDKEDAAGNLQLIRPLPKQSLITILEDCVVKSNGTLLKNTNEYQNYITSLTNIQSDQRIYLQNRLQYGNDWENARKYYEKALEFYQHEGIYGFVVKIRTESVNTSMKDYHNKVDIELDDKDWSTSDDASVQFSGGIIGSYNIGDIVLQKADKFYDTDNTVSDIQKVEKENAGLKGAEFKIYCGDATDTPPALSEENLAHFLDKDASINGKTYRYTHTGNDHVGNFHGDINTLVTDDEGKLAFSNIVPAHNHWLVETKAPEGYYLNSTPMKVESNSMEVNYELVPNVSRSIQLYKEDSFSKTPIKGAKFALYTADGRLINGFTSKEVNGHTSYWKSDTGNAVLETNSEGLLCIHGLDAGEYVLKETQVAPGYITPNPLPEYSFTLEETLPQNSGKYDEAYHYLITTKDTPLKNDPDVAELEMTKKGIGNVLLEGTGFTLFRFIGTEAQWNSNPDEETLWKPVHLNDIQYFQTANTTEKVTLQGNYPWPDTEIDAVITDTNGKFSITNIPVGHYSVTEVKVSSPAYHRDYRSFYFTVDGDSVGTSLQLYTEPGEKNELKDNTLMNYKKKAKLALVKYDENGTKPEVEGEKLGEGYQYTEKVLKDGSAKGLQGAVYKLFMRRGAVTGTTNPDPEQLETEEVLKHKPGFDVCVAKGETDENGVLKLSDMRGVNQDVAIDGLTPEEYYMIEVKAPKGYLRDQTPIHFSLKEEVFENDLDIPGLVMMATNAKTDYGIRLTKIDASTAAENTPVGLAGAEFEVTQDANQLYFIGTNGSYQSVAEGTVNATTTVVTGEGGKLTITGLKENTKYTLTETKPPRGYQKSDTPTEITTPSDTTNGLLENGILFPLQDLKIENERLLGQVTLHKQAVETGEALKGAEFTLYETIVTVIPPDDPDYDPTYPNGTRSEDVVVDVQTTDENGNITFDNLPWSQFYYIQETKAPEGYMLDQTKRMFSIDENSFDANGNAIPIRYPSIVNNKGTLGEALLIKVDAENHEKRLEDAHFYLEKYLGVDAAGKEIWVGYGQGMYKTDKKGEIPFLLPPGKYKLIEMKAPDGYLLEGMKELFFNIEEPQDGSKPPLVIIDEEDSHDGVVTNQKGETGVYIKKTIEGTNVAVPNVTFQFYWHHDPMISEPIREDVYFIPKGDGNYEYTDDATLPEATKELVTNKNGEIYVMLPASFKQGSPNPPSGLYLSTFRYEETAAPDNIEKPLKSGDIPPLKDNIYVEIPVENKLKENVKNDLSISIYKTDGKSKLGLAGAEFELFTTLDLGTESVELRLSKDTTDQQGYLHFDETLDGKPLELTVGGTYYIRELKAPEGYILDKTVHQITLDENHFDENFHFIPIQLSLQNYQIQGSVHLKKVDAQDNTKGLAGAEFELLRKTEDATSIDTQWEHYGLPRYITDETGTLFIKNLPYGTYRLIERAAPLGYLLENPSPTVEFQIIHNNKMVELGSIENKVDPNPVRDVFVKKVAKEDTNKVLAGAEFELYEMKEDGNPHLRQQKTYVTDSNGEFVIKQLPVGSYALKELKAPIGYDVPKQNMTYFTVKTEERVVMIQIENAKSSSSIGGGDHTGGGEQNDSKTAVTVQKVWENDESNMRPDSVSVQLYCNGEAYGDSVELNDENNWKYIWESLDSNANWTVDEVDILNGYEKLIEHKDNVWTITNRAKNESSTNPSRPSRPSRPDKPSNPEEPESSNPEEPSLPVQPNTPEYPEHPTEPSLPVNPDDSSISEDFTSVENPSASIESNIESNDFISSANEANLNETNLAQSPYENSDIPSAVTDTYFNQEVIDDVPQTEDRSHLYFWLCLMCFSAIGFGIVWKKSTKKH